jgi:hypothetical protein
MLHGMHPHLIENRRRLTTQHLHDPHVVLGMEIPHQHPVSQHPIQQAILRPAARDPAILAHGDGRLLPRQRQQRGVRRAEQLHRLFLGRQAREEGQRREDGVLEDAGQARVVQRLVGELGEKRGQDEQAAPADRGGSVVGEGEKDGEEEWPVLGDEGGL